MRVENAIDGRRGSNSNSNSSSDQIAPNAVLLPKAASTFTVYALDASCETSVVEELV